MDGLSIAAIITSGISAVVSICTVVVVCVKTSFKDEQKSQIKMKYNKNGDVTLDLKFDNNEEFTQKYTYVKNNNKSSSTSQTTDKIDSQKTQNKGMILEKNEEFDKVLDTEGEREKLLENTTSNIFKEAFGTFKEIVINGGGKEGDVIKVTGDNDHHDN